MLADRYPEDEERGKAMGTALGGLALGVLSEFVTSSDKRARLLNPSWTTVRRIDVSIRG